MSRASGIIGVVGGNHQEHGVDAGDALPSMLCTKRSCPGTRRQSRWSRPPPPAGRRSHQVDGHAALVFLRQAVGTTPVSAFEPDVVLPIDVAGGGDDHARGTSKACAGR